MTSKTFSIKQKLIFSLLTAVLAASVLVGSVSQWISRDLVTEKVEQVELPSQLRQVGNQVDREASVMLSVAQSIATNPMITQWSASGADKDGERKLVEYLNNVVAFNDLTVASFADRQTYRYWNQDGFLRELKNDEYDGWFFAYKDSGEAVSLSLYNEPGAGYRLFANFQQLNGRGMSGVARSVDGLLRIMNDVKIAESGFLFLIDGSGTVIAHPDTSILGSSTLSELSDGYVASQLTNGESYAMAETVIDDETMLFASTYVDRAGWYVVAQVPKHELYASLDESGQLIIFWSVVIAAVFAVLGILLAGSLSRPIIHLADTFHELGRGEGDLTTRIKVPRQTETARLVEGFNNFISHLHTTISAVAKTGRSLTEDASDVAHQSHLSEDITKVQRDHTMQVASALTQMGSTVGEIAESANRAASSANTATNNVLAGRDITRQAVEDIHTLSSQVEDVAQVIASLDEHTSAIGGILDTIRGISEQTNLLALNAAIEAARAGDHGRGFSVVADEVRGLAQRASDATDEIQTKIDKFQADSQAAVAKMETSKSQTGHVVEATTNIDNLLSEISQEIEAINDLNTQVAAATEQQSIVIEDVSRSINDISSGSEENLSAMTSLVRLSEKLDALSSELASQVGRFKL
ncbi:methyl-accepting chemotaxis protein [Alteromonas halophila]|uniref:Energy taxis-modulating methyl-accepting chemotaxis protein with Cache_1 sensory domain n=1 Tax=Alteromonas halophila TaxID=516698 RepID=A0A918JFC0_9ALTE|nr:methyl-accepting chemotaxis protein [Alteromonas halophila]GGW78471.1 energy taxis-modulating methyl-accepting chemotaxis protein with Cache_1 sensory domain [Alteromonas halophila]